MILNEKVSLGFFIEEVHYLAFEGYVDSSAVNECVTLFVIKCNGGNADDKLIAVFLDYMKVKLASHHLIDHDLAGNSGGIVLIRECEVLGADAEDDLA